MAFFLTLLLYVGVFLLTELLRPKPEIEQAKPAGLGDFNFPTAEEGRAAQVIWGTVRLNGPNLGWYGDLQAKKIKEKVSSGLFNSKDVVVGFEYSLGIDFMMCRGNLNPTPAITGGTGLRRIWVDDVELRPASAGWVSSGTININDENFFGKDVGGIVGTLRFYGGTNNETQNAYMAGLPDIDATLLPNYKNQCHLVLERVYIGNQPSLRPWAFELRRIPNGLGLADSDALVNGNDANPANVLYEIFTDPEWGLGLTNVDETQLAAAGVILASENNGYSRILDRGLQAVELIAEVEQQVDGFMVQDPVSKEWQLRLIRETDYPSPLTDVPLFDESNTMSLEFSRGAWADTTNQVKVQYTDRSNDYKSTFAVAQDMANKVIQNNDDVIATQNYPAVQEASLANELAWRDLRTLSYPLAKGKLKADRSNYLLRPGDLARITWPPYDIEDFFVRINKVSLGTAEANEMIYDWTEDVFRAEVPSFADPTSSLWTPLDDDPVNVSAARVWELPLGYQEVSDSQQIGLLAVRANGTQTGYDVYIKEDASLPIDTSRTGTTLDTQVSPFTPAALLDGAIEINEGSPNNFNNDTILINTATDIDLVNETHVLADLDGDFPPNLALINDEIIFYESVTSLGGGAYQMNNCYRGMLDTAVARHEDNSIVWFFTYGIGNLQTILDPSTVGLSVWFMSSSGAGDQGPPDSSPTGSPEIGVNRTLELTEGRYKAPGAAVNVSIDGVRLGDVDTLGDSFTINWRSRVPSFTDRSKTQEDAHESGSGYTYNVRVYHTGVSPEVEVFNQTGISADGGTSPVGGTQLVSGYAVDFSPLASPWPSPQPFEQTYRIEIEAVNNSPEQISQMWSRDFTRT